MCSIHVQRLTALLSILLLGGGMACSKSATASSPFVRIVLWDDASDEPLYGHRVQAETADGLVFDEVLESGNWLELKVAPEDLTMVRVFDWGHDPAEAPKVILERPHPKVDVDKELTVSLRLQLPQRPMRLRVVAAESGEPLARATLSRVTFPRPFGDPEYEPLGTVDARGEIVLDSRQYGPHGWGLVIRHEGRIEQALGLTPRQPMREGQVRLVAMLPEAWLDHELDSEAREQARSEFVPDPSRAHGLPPIFAFGSREVPLHVETPREWGPSVLGRGQVVLRDESASSCWILASDPNGQLIWSEELDLVRAGRAPQFIDGEWQPTAFLGLYSDPPRSDLRAQVYVEGELMHDGWVWPETGFRPISIPTGECEVRFFLGREEIRREFFETTDQEYKPIRFELK